MTIKILKKIVLVISATLAFQTVYGMSQEGNWESVPTNAPLQIPLPHLRSQSEGSREHSANQAPEKKLNEQEVQKLLENEVTIPMILFTEKNLGYWQPRLGQVGILKISPNAQAYPVRLMMLIERYFPHLLELQLKGLQIGDTGFKALAESTIATRLKKLILWECRITDQGFKTENFNRFTNLEVLELGGAELRTAEFKALAESTIAAQLKKLVVIGYGRDSLVFTTNDFNRFTSLEELRLNGNQLGDVVFKALAESTIAAQLKRLVLFGGGITAQEFTIHNFNRFTSLEVLSLDPELSDEIILSVIMGSNLCQTLQNIYGVEKAIFNDVKSFCNIKKR